MSKAGKYSPRIIVAIPAMDESGYIEKSIEAISKQTYKSFLVIVCVNQPDHWWNDPCKKFVCESNMNTIAFLKNVDSFKLDIIDRSSPGYGFGINDKGVGHARNILFERALNIADENDLVMCMDADTLFEPGYFESVADAFHTAPDAIAHANPYYHNLTGNVNSDRAVLRYEIYMRLYMLNLWRIGSPYAFSPLGSAITMYAKSLKAIGKIAPKPAGEDFYLLQKLRKHGRVIQYNEHFVYPSARTSNRVPFGTGPAVADGIKNLWGRYPIYPTKPFSMIEETYKLFPVLFDNDVPTPLDDFFENIFGTRKIFDPLRSNYKTLENFTRACHIKIDGLRILQFVKYYHSVHKVSDEQNLSDNLRLIFDKNEKIKIKYFFSPFKFENISISLLQNLRNLLAQKEQEYRKIDFYEPKLSF